MDEDIDDNPINKIPNPTAILSSAGANKTAKRAAVIHLSFNVLGAAIYGVIMTIFFGIFPDLALDKIAVIQVPIFCPKVIKIADLQFTIPLIANVCKIPTDAEEL